MTIVVYGPQGCGKTRAAAALAKHFNCSQVVDDWDGQSDLPARSLALTNDAPRGLGYLCMPFDEACRRAGISVSSGS